MNISIIIVNWNTKDMLVNCLESIYRTQKSAFEVWVVDNGSADGSAEAVKVMFPRARLIENQENLGFAKANNQALKLASGSYLVLLNSDCVLGPGSLDTMIKFMSGHVDVAICSPQLLNEDSTRQNSIANIPTLSTELLNKSLLRRLFPEKYPGKGKALEGCFPSRRRGLPSSGREREKIHCKGADRVLEVAVCVFQKTQGRGGKVFSPFRALFKACNKLFREYFL